MSRNQTKTLLGIETKKWRSHCKKSKQRRNQTKTLLGIETEQKAIAQTDLSCRNQTKTLLGIET